MVDLSADDQIADSKKADVTRALSGFRPGDQVKAKILSIDTAARKINFGIKASYFAEAGQAANGAEDVEMDSGDAQGDSGENDEEDDDEDEEDVIKLGEDSEDEDALAGPMGSDDEEEDDDEEEEEDDGESGEEEEDEEDEEEEDDVDVSYIPSNIDQKRDR